MNYFSGDLIIVFLHFKNSFIDIKFNFSIFGLPPDHEIQMNDGDDTYKLEF